MYNYLQLEQTFKKVDYNSRHNIELFISMKQKYEPAYGNYYFGINYLNAQWTDNRKYYYGIFDYESDSIFAAVSKIRMGKAQYNRLLDIPISLSGNLDNEIKFMDLLFKEEYIEQSYISKNNLARINNNEYFVDDLADQNFYSNVKQRLRHGYKNPGRLKLITDGKEFCFRTPTIEDKAIVYKCFEQWANIKGENLHSNVLFKRYFENYNTIIIYNLARQFILTYKDICLALVVFIPTLSGYCYQPIQFTVPRFEKYREDVLLWKILSQIGELLERLYITELDKLGYEYVSYAGSASNNRGLLRNKNMLSTGSIDYFRITRR